MIFNYIKGDMFHSDLPVLAHGCNIEGSYAAGVAGHMRKNYGSAYRAYANAVAAKEFPLGAAQLVMACYRTTTDKQVRNTRGVFNLGTQQSPGEAGPSGPWAVFLAFANMFEMCEINGIFEVGIPKIGTGIARQEWETVTHQISRAAAQTATSVRLVVFEI